MKNTIFKTLNVWNTQETVICAKRKSQHSVANKKAPSTATATDSKKMCIRDSYKECVWSDPNCETGPDTCVCSYISTDCSDIVRLFNRLCIERQHENIATSAQIKIKDVDYWKLFGDGGGGGCGRKKRKHGRLLPDTCLLYTSRCV